MLSIDGTSGPENSGHHLLIEWGETLIPSLSPYHPLLSLLTSFPLSPNRLTPDTSPHPHLPTPPSFTGPFRTRILFSIPRSRSSLQSRPFLMRRTGRGEGRGFFSRICDTSVAPVYDTGEFTCHSSLARK